MRHVLSSFVLILAVPFAVLGVTQEKTNKQAILDAVGVARAELAKMTVAADHNDAAGIRAGILRLGERLTAVEEAAKKLPDEAAGVSSLTPREGNNEVSGDTTTVVARVKPALLQEQDRALWVAVVPERAPGSMWIQGMPVTQTEESRIIHLGRPDPADRGWFKVVLISARKGAIAGEGEVLISKLAELDIKEQSFLNLHRTQ